MLDGNIRAILLDIEGTTTPVEFVYEVLFPFARRHVNEFLEQHHHDEDVRADLRALEAEHRADVESGLEPPSWKYDSAEARVESASRYVHWLMDQDRKSTPLKSLQGKIWKAGYLDGKLRGEVYADVLPAFARWQEQKRSIYIYSSGSVLAQKLLFAHTIEGDLTRYINGYFDTTTGDKKKAASYQRISEKIGLPAQAILFLSDVSAELDAAREAGMMTALCIRGESAATGLTHRVIRTFEALPGYL